MIQLASQATASRSNQRPTQSDGKVAALDGRRGRNGHAWPFPSRYAVRPQQATQKPTASESGS